MSIPPTLCFYWDSVPNPDAPRGLCVLHVFAVATGAKSPLLPTSFDSRVQIRPFCTRQTIFERRRVQIRPFCPRRLPHCSSRVQIVGFCPRRPSLMLSRTAARARSAQGTSQFAAGHAAARLTRGAMRIALTINYLIKIRVGKT